jgi:hypothetical protein
MVSGGVTTPVADSRLFRVPGGHVQAGLALRMQSALSSRLRLDAAYHSLDGTALPSRPPSNPQVWIVTASVVKDIGAFREFRPYLIAGIGTTSLDEQGTRQSKLNLSGGAGITLPPVGRMRPFIEVRYLQLMGSLANTFVPLSFGVAF